MAGGFLPPVVAELTASTSEWTEKIASAKEKLLGLHEGSDNDVPILANIDDLSGKLAAAKARLAEVTSQAEADPVVIRASVADFDAKMAEVRGAISDLRASTADDQVDLRANLALLDADLAEAKAKVDAVAREGSLNPIELRVATGDLDAKLAEADGKLAATKGAMEETASSGESSLLNLSSAGPPLLMVAGAAAAVGAVSIDMGEKFQSATAQIAAASGTTVAQAQKVAQAFLGTAGDSTFSAQQMVEAYGPVSGQLAQVQGHVLDAQQALAVMRASSDLAEASGSDLGSTTSALAATMQSYGVKASEAADTSDVLYNVSRRLNIPVAGVSDALDKLHGRLGTVTPSMTDVGALMVELGQHGIQGSRGVQVVQTAMQTLVGGSKATTAQLGALGVHVFDAQGKFVGMGSVIDQLKPKLAGMSQAQQDAALKTLFGASASQVMNSIIAGGTSGWDSATKAVGAYGTAQSAGEKRSATLHGALEKLKASTENAAAALGVKLIPVVTKLADYVDVAVKWIVGHWPEISAVFKRVVDAVKPTIEGVIHLIGGMMRIIEGIVEFLKGIFTGHWSEAWDGIKRIFSGVVETIKGEVEVMFGALLGIIVKGMSAVGHVFESGWDAVVRFFTGLPGKVIGAVGDGAKVLLEWGGKLVTGALNGIVAVESTLWDWFTKAPGKVLSLVGDGLKILAKWGGDVVTGVLNGIHDVEGTVWGWVTAAPGKFVSLLGDGAKVLVGWGGDLLRGLWSGLTDAWHALGDIGSTIEGWFTSALSDAGSWLIGVGKDVLHGLAQGLLSAAEATVGHIPVIGSHIVGMLKDALGVKSPSTITHEIGVNLMQGLTNGIVATGGSAVSAVRTVAGQLVGAAQTPGARLALAASTAPALAGPGLLAGGGGGPMVVNIDGIHVAPPNGLDTAAWAAAIRTELLQTTARQTGNILGSAAGATVRTYGP